MAQDDLPVPRQDDDHIFDVGAIDHLVRNTMLRAGTDVTSRYERNEYEADMDFLRRRRKAREVLVRRRAAVIIWLFGSIGISAIGIAATVFTQWLRSR